MHQLVDRLTERRRLGFPLARLVFHSCADLTDEQKAELQELVSGEVIEVESMLSDDVQVSRYETWSCSDWVVFM